MDASAIRAIVVMVVGTLLAIVMLAIFRPGDNTQIILQIVGVVAPTTAALLALMRGNDNHAKLASQDDKLNNLQITVDGRLSQLLETSTQAAHSAGVHQGEQDQRDRTPEAPTGPTTIAPGGPTTIVVDPTSEVQVKRP